MAELLLRDGDPVSSSAAAAGELADGAPESARTGGVDRALVTRSERPAEPRAVLRFTELLLYGHRKEALGERGLGRTAGGGARAVGGAV